VGEPWNYRAIKDNIGYTAVTSQQLWKDHPEKVCASMEEFATRNPRTVKAILKALHLASTWADKMENRPKLAEVVSRPAYINCPLDIILARRASIHYGDGRSEQDANYMIFSDREWNYPQKAFGLWWLSQFRRWGIVKDVPDYAGVTSKVMRPDLYLQAMKEMGLTPKVTDMQPVKLIDSMFDPRQPEQYAKSFAVHNIS
jgi:nitrate/nitrite transport system substrate-binding protein